MKLFNFRKAIFRVFLEDHYCETDFDNELIVPASPGIDLEYEARAEALGYGADVWQMCLEHEFLHSWMAEKEGLSCSPTLYAVATQDFSLPPEAYNKEERLVLGFQRFANDGTSYEELDIWASENSLSLQKLREEFSLTQFMDGSLLRNDRHRLPGQHGRTLLETLNSGQQTRGT